MSSAPFLTYQFSRLVNRLKLGFFQLFQNSALPYHIFTDEDYVMQ